MFDLYPGQTRYRLWLWGRSVEAQTTALALQYPTTALATLRGSGARE